MAGLHSDFSSRSNHRWSAPCHSSITPARSRDGLGTSFEFGTARHLRPPTATTLELSGDSSSTQSTWKPSKEQSEEWRHSFFRVGPLIGLAVCERVSLKPVSGPLDSNYPASRRDLVNTVADDCITIPTGTAFSLLADICFFRSAEDVRWPRDKGLEVWSISLHWYEFDWSSSRTRS